MASVIRRPLPPWLVALCDLQPADAVDVAQASMTDRCNARRNGGGAYEKYSPASCEPAGSLLVASGGGFEIAAMAGTLLEAASARLPVVVDVSSPRLPGAAFSIDQSWPRNLFFQPSLK